MDEKYELVGGGKVNKKRVEKKESYFYWYTMILNFLVLLLRAKRVKNDTSLIFLFA